MMRGIDIFCHGSNVVDAVMKLLNIDDSIKHLMLIAVTGFTI